MGSATAGTGEGGGLICSTAGAATVPVAGRALGPVSSMAFSRSSSSMVNVGSFILEVIYKEITNAGRK